MNNKTNIIKEPVETYNQTFLAITNYTSEKKLHPILKWAGGKEKELKFIIPNLPNVFENLHEQLKKS